MPNRTRLLQITPTWTHPKLRLTHFFATKPPQINRKSTNALGAKPERSKAMVPYPRLCEEKISGPENEFKDNVPIYSLYTTLKVAYGRKKLETANFIYSIENSRVAGVSFKLFAMNFLGYRQTDNYTYYCTLLHYCYRNTYFLLVLFPIAYHPKT